METNNNIPLIFNKKHPLSNLFTLNRFYVAVGGRASGKSWGIIELLVRVAYEANVKILCCRELQNSIAESSHALIEKTINTLGMSSKFNITNNYISSHTGAEFIFKGIRHSPTEIKSLEGIDICFVEEADLVSKTSWDILIPTIRKEGSIIILAFNPSSADTYTYQHFILNTPPKTVVMTCNYTDNPFVSQTIIDEAEYCRETDIEKYNNIWLGQPLKISNAVIFKDRFVVEDFESSYTNIYYHGLDLGYANDPTALVRCFIKDQDLYIDKELGGVGIDTDDLVKLIKTVDTAKYSKILADNSRPETIAYLFKKGLNVVGAKKGAGSVADGITFLKSFRKIHIHYSCTEVIKEFNNYSWKVDRLTGNILPIPVDNHNHYIDSIRYAISEVIKSSGDMSIWAKLGS